MMMMMMMMVTMNITAVVMITMTVHIFARRFEARAWVKFRIWAAKVSNVAVRKVRGTGELAIASQVRTLQYYGF